MDREQLLTMDKADAIAALADEANWPAMNPITAALWLHLTPEQRYAWATASHRGGRRISKETGKCQSTEV